MKTVYQWKYVGGTGKKIKLGDLIEASVYRIYEKSNGQEDSDDYAGEHFEAIVSSFANSDY